MLHELTTLGNGIVMRFADYLFKIVLYEVIRAIYTVEPCITKNCFTLEHKKNPIC